MGRIPPNFCKCVIGCQDGSQPFTVEASFVVMFLITWNYFRIQSVCDGLNCVPLKFLCSSSNPQNLKMWPYSDIGLLLMWLGCGRSGAGQTPYPTLILGRECQVKGQTVPREMPCEDKLRLSQAKLHQITGEPPTATRDIEYSSSQSRRNQLWRHLDPGLLIHFCCVSHLASGILLQQPYQRDTWWKGGLSRRPESWSSLCSTACYRFEFWSYFNILMFGYNSI